jgi:hypothetical protein
LNIGKLVFHVNDAKTEKSYSVLIILVGWLRQRTGAGLAVVGRSSCGHAIETCSTLLTPVTSCVVLALLYNTHIQHTNKTFRLLKKILSKPENPFLNLKIISKPENPVSSCQTQ